MWQCNECGQQYENPRSGSNHIRWHHKKITYSKEAIERRAKKPIVVFKKKCENCGEKFESLRDKKCCSTYCASRLAYQHVNKNNISKGMKRHIKENPDHPWIQPWKSEKRYTSQNEVKIREYFRLNFPNDDWTFGTLCHYKWTQLNPDLWSKKLRVVFEYDGIWHFKDVHGQLKRKKLKDKLLEKWCKKNSYRLIRISDDEFLKHGFDHWIKILKNEIYFGTSFVKKYYAMTDSDSIDEQLHQSEEVRSQHPSGII